MSEATTAPGASASSAARRSASASSRGQSGAVRVLTRPVGPFPLWVWLAVGGGLVGWRLYANSKAASAAASSANPSTTSAQDTSSIYSGSAAQDQVPQFVGQTYVTTSPPVVTTPVTVVPPPAGQPTPTPGGTVSQFPAPVNLKASGVSKSGATLSWTPRASGSIFPGSFTVAVYDAKGKLVSQSTVSTPDATKGIGTTTLTGLPKNSQLHANVWANGGRTAPPHATVQFKTAA